MGQTSSKTHIFGLARKELLLLVLLFLIWRLALFGLSALAPSLLPFKASFPYSNQLPLYGLPYWVSSFANFDGVHYLTIARSGYLQFNFIQAFFPLFPLILLHIPKMILLDRFNELSVGLLISNLSFLVLLPMWFAFVKESFGKKVAWYSSFALLVFPTSFYFGALYTESTFLLLTIGCFYAAKKRMWYIAALLALIASSARLVGIFLVPALFIEFIRIEHVRRLGSVHAVKRVLAKYWKQLTALALGSLGLLLYMGYLYRHFNDALYFLHVQPSFGAGRQTSIVPYPQVAYRALKILLTVKPTSIAYLTYLQEFVTGFFALPLLLAIIKKVPLSYVFFALCALLLPTTTGTFSSMPRYVLVSFPLFIYIGMMTTKHKLLAILWFSVSIAFLVINTVLFCRGYWIA